MKKLSTLSLIAITVSAIVSLRGLTLMASNGYLTLFLASAAALFFLVPSTYVCVQLATHTRKRGGVYEWIKHAFGQSWGFIAIWMEWINNVVSFPITLATIVSMAYSAFGLNTPNTVLLTISMLAVLWLALIYNNYPLRFSSYLNILGSLSAILTALLIVSLGIIYGYSHSFHFANLQPDYTGHWFNQIALFVSFIAAYSGMQITGFHTEDVADPKRQYRIALPIAAVVITFIVLASSFVIALTVPRTTLNVIVLIEQVLQIFFKQFHWPTYFNLFVSGFILIAMLAGFSAWLIGPARGMQAALAEINIFPYFAQCNRFAIPARLLWLQGIITSLLITLFITTPSTKFIFFILLAIASQFVALMYILIFAAGLKLIARTVFGKMLCILGILSCSIGFLEGISAPSQLRMNDAVYMLVVIGGDLTIIGLGLFIVRGIISLKSKTHLLSS